jgi:hypothetical protein
MHLPTACRPVQYLDGFTDTSHNSLEVIYNLIKFNDLQERGVMLKISDSRTLDIFQLNFSLDNLHYDLKLVF